VILCQPTGCLSPRSGQGLPRSRNKLDYITEWCSHQLSRRYIPNLIPSVGQEKLVVRIVCPNAESPFPRPYEISMELTYPQVINCDDFFQVGDSFDRDPLAVMRRQRISRTQFLGANPPLASDEEGMFPGRANSPTSDLQSQDLRLANERL